MSLPINVRRSKSVVELATRAGWSVVDAAAPRLLWPGAGVQIQEFCVT